MPDSPSPSPIVTIVTVTFNLVKAGRQDVFRQCIESVHAQEYDHVEHLVIDGASTDGTRELLAEYEAKGWLRCVSEPDTGIYDAMNRGLRHAQGKYIAYLNSDDYWHDPHAVACSVRFLEETGAAFSYAPYTLVSEEGQFIRTTEPRMETFICDMPIGHPTMFVRTELMRQLGGFDDANYRIIADYDLVTRLLLRGHNGVYVPLNFTSFRLGGISAQQEHIIRRRQEHCTLYSKNYAPLLGMGEGQPLSMHNLPANLLPALAGRLHPNVYTQLCTFVQGATKTARLRLAPTRPDKTKWNGPLGIPMLTRTISTGGAQTCWKLLGFLPLLSTQRRSKDGSLHIISSSKLLGILPIWKSKVVPGTSQKHYLFGFIPMGGVRRQG